MLIALRNRINVLDAISRMDEVDGLQLTNADGKPFSLPEAFGNRPIIEAGGVVGRVLFRDRPARRLNDNGDGSMIFVGFAKALWVTMTIVQRPRSRRMCSSTTALASGSKALHGSSSSNTWGLSTSARARHNR